MARPILALAALAALAAAACGARSTLDLGTTTATTPCSTRWSACRLRPESPVVVSSSTEAVYQPRGLAWTGDHVLLTYDTFKPEPDSNVPGDAVIAAVDQNGNVLSRRTLPLDASVLTGDPRLAIAWNPHAGVGVVHGKLGLQWIDALGAPIAQPIQDPSVGAMMPTESGFLAITLAQGGGPVEIAELGVAPGAPAWVPLVGPSYPDPVSGWAGHFSAPRAGRVHWLGVEVDEGGTDTDFQPWVHSAYRIPGSGPPTFDHDIAYPQANQRMMDDIAEVGGRLYAAFRDYGTPSVLCTVADAVTNESWTLDDDSFTKGSPMTCTLATLDDGAVLVFDSADYELKVQALLPGAGSLQPPFFVRVMPSDPYHDATISENLGARTVQTSRGVAVLWGEQTDIAGRATTKVAYLQMLDCCED